MKANKRSGPFTHEDKEPTLKFKSRYEVTTFSEKQHDILKLAFSERPKSMLMVSIESGIFRANICRWISKMQRAGKIQLVKVGLCQVSKYKAGFYMMKGAADV